MGSLMAEGKDVKRWVRQGRMDILRYVSVVGPPRDPWADLWIDSETDAELDCCPFVRKVGKIYHCAIYDTRPQVCRDYVPWAPGSKCEEVS
jgi:Fe-S-cluster containining protein